MSYFVTGTDTGVGKTVVATLLARRLGAHYWKPIQTGDSRDTDFARRWNRDRVWPEAVRLPSECAPSIAARIAGVSIAWDEKLTRLPGTGPIIVEGAGGVLVPIDDRHSMIDLIQALQLPTVVVASTRLGTINHTRLTIEALLRRDLKIAAVILNGKPDDSTADAVSEIEELVNVSTLGPLPWTAEFSENWFDAAADGLKGWT